LRNRILLLLAVCGLIASASAQSNFNRLNFAAGGGIGVGRADVASYVGNSYFGVAGGGINFGARQILAVKSVLIPREWVKPEIVMERAQ